MSQPFLSVAGPTLVAGQGRPISLRGYNVGGWLNMENFLTGYPSSDSNFRAALRELWGAAKYELFFETFYRSFFGDDDAAYLSSLGLNSIRIPFGYRRFEDDARPFVLKDEGFRELDRALQACAKHGLYAVLDLHAVPGSQNQHWHSDNSTHVAGYWGQAQFQDRMVHLWEAIADRYRDNPTVAGYNLLNEPGDRSGTALKPFYDRTIAAIRAIDPLHVIFLDGNRYATDFTPFASAELHPNTVYSAHDYKLPGFADGGPYPGVSRGVYVDRQQVRDSFLQRTEFMRMTGTPIWIGECGPLFPLRSRNLAERYALLVDQLDVYNEYGAGWALWAYKDVGGQGLVYADPESPWMQRMAPIIDKKGRLGVDGWGSTDEGIREVMAPIEALFDREFPGFDPYPFGRADWIATLVRNIVFAEPMLADAMARLAGPWTDAEIVALAESFKFANGVRRSPLADILKRAAAAPVVPSR
jgi:hypothetical protein